MKSKRCFETGRIGEWGFFGVLASTKNPSKFFWREKGKSLSPKAIHTKTNFDQDSAKFLKSMRYDVKMTKMIDKQKWRNRQFKKREISTTLRFFKNAACRNHFRSFCDEVGGWRRWIIEIIDFFLFIQEHHREGPEQREGRIIVIIFLMNKIKRQYSEDANRG